MDRYKPQKIIINVCYCKFDQNYWTYRIGAVSLKYNNDYDSNIETYVYMISYH